MQLFLLVMTVKLPWKDRRKMLKYCKSIIFQVWDYIKFKTPKIHARVNGTGQNKFMGINDQWVHTMNVLCSQGIPGDEQSFELRGCRQMLASGGSCHRVPRVPDLCLQGCQILTALCSWKKEPQILGLSHALQYCSYSKDSWSTGGLLLQRQGSKPGNLPNRIWDLNLQDGASRGYEQLKNHSDDCGEVSISYFHFSGLILHGDEVVIYY